MSDYIRQESVLMHFNSGSWVVLSSIEQQIKNKIEKFGKPLREWDINIYRGILTGYNEAFIIDGETRDKLISISPKNDEIIRPILRGRDVQKYSCSFNNLYLINSHNGVKANNVPRVDVMNDYPIIFDFLNQFKEKIQLRTDQGDHWSNLRNCAYLFEFDKPKIIFPNMTKFLPFYYDVDGYYTNQKCFIITGKHIAFLTAFLNSSLFKFCFKDNFPELQGGTRELSKIFFDKIPVKEIDDGLNLKFEEKVIEVQSARMNKNNSRLIEIEIDNLIFDVFQISDKERNLIGFIEIK